MPNLFRGEVGRELDQLGDPRYIGWLQDNAEDLLRCYRDQPDESLEYGDLSERQRNNHQIVLFGLAELAEDRRWSFGELSAARLSFRACDGLLELRQEYRDSLPYSAAECQWLGSLSAGVSDHHPHGAGFVEAQSAILVSAGRERNTSGKELLVRGWDWMRGGDDFEATTTFRSATSTALRAISLAFDRDTADRELARMAGQPLDL